MTNIFLAQTSISATLADQLRQELTSKGYIVPDHLNPVGYTAPLEIERAILRSAAVVLLWESNAANPEWEALYIRFAQRFRKSLFPVLLDSTPLPATLSSSASMISGQLSSDAIVAALLTLSGFPAPDREDDLSRLYQQAMTSQNRLRDAKAALDIAATMLVQDQYRNEVIALLAYLEKKDVSRTIQVKAKEVLTADARRRPQVPPFAEAEVPFKTAGTCAQGHVSYYDKRIVCHEYREVVLGNAASAFADSELHLPCRERGCNLKVVVRVNCGDYQ